MLRSGTLRIATAVTVLGSLLCCGAAAAADGDLDPSFGTGGRFSFGLESSSGAEGVSTIHLLSGGGFFTTGPGAGNGAWTTRHASTGALEGPYGDGTGSAHIVLPTYSFSRQSVVQADGSIINAGGVAGFDTLLTRLNPAGVLDPTFGNDSPNPPGDGISRYDFGNDDISNGVALQGDRAVIAGRVGASGSHDVLIARFNTDGSVDPTFGPPGFRTNLGGDEFGDALAVQPDGKVVVAGTSGPLPFVLRYTAAGVLDPTFGGGDGIEMPVPGLTGPKEPSAVLIDPAGNILIDSYESSGGGSALTRLQPDGSPDPGFGTGGTTSFLPAAGEDLYLFGLALMDDGRVLAAGNVQPATGGDQVLVTRLLANGQPDPAWGGNGSRTYGGGLLVRDDGSTVAVLPGRRVLIGGNTFGSSNSDALLLKLLGDTTPPDTVITRAPKNKVTPRKAVGFRFEQGNDINSTYECKLQRPKPKRNKGKKPKKPKKPVFTACSSPKVVKGVRRTGKYTFLVRATDPAGNVDPTPAKRSFRVAPRKHR